MLLPILPWYDVYLLISGLVAPSPLLPILATDQRKPDTTQTYTKHASESNAASIHQNSRFHSAPQTYNKPASEFNTSQIPVAPLVQGERSEIGSSPQEQV